MASIDSTSWKVRRLLAMSPTEVGLRIVRGIARRTRRPREPVAQSEMMTVESALADPIRPEDIPRWLMRELADGRGRLLRGARDGDETARALEELGVATDVVRAADQVLAGSVPAFGWTELAIGEEPDWVGDPVSGDRWPLRFWSDLDFRASGALGDPRYVWEVNRHHHLVTLARAYAITGEPRYADRVWADIRSWIAQNPPLFGINWASALELAIRLMSWAMAVDIVGSDGARDGDVADVAVSVSLQTRHLSDNLSVYASSRNNHLIGEVAGLLVASAKFPFLRRSAALGERGRRLLEREMIAQVCADGVSREQAFQYQTFVLEFGLLGAAASSSLGTSLAPETIERMGAMSRFLSDVSGIGGVPPSVGDEDGGRAFELSDRRGRQSAGAAAAVDVLIGDDRPMACEPSDLEPAVWLFGPEAVAAARAGGNVGADIGGVETARAGGPRDSSFYREGGYFVPAAGEHRGVIDCGPLGYLSIAAHGHADCLSLSVSHRGRWVLVDPGTYCYHREPLWRDHFRGTAAHNTVSVDGHDQSEMLGPFMWGRSARATALAWASTPDFDYFEGEHDGFRPRTGVRHRRSVFFGKRGYWLILDHVEGTGPHRVDATFQLADGHSRATDEGLVFTMPDGTGLRLEAWLPDGVGIEVAEGEEDPPRGWVSGGFGHRRPAPAVVATGTVELPATLVFAVIPFEGETAVEVRCSTGRWTTGAALEVSYPGGRELVFFGEPEGLSGGERFRGRLGFRKEREGAGDSRAAGFEVSEWTKAGAELGHDPVADLLQTGA